MARGGPWFSKMTVARAVLSGSTQVRLEGWLVVVDLEDMVMYPAIEHLQQITGDLTASGADAGAEGSFDRSHIRVADRQHHGIVRGALVALETMWHADFLCTGETGPERHQPMTGCH